MTEQKIAKLFRGNGMGAIDSSIEPVSGGLLHKMYKVTAAGRTFAVKHLNPEIMKRPDAAANFAEAEKLESVMETAGIPIVPALRFAGRKMQCIDGEYFYIFDWHTGKTADREQITANRCRQVGAILGRMHALDPKTGVKADVEERRIDWSDHLQRAFAAEYALGKLLSENEPLLRHVEDKLIQSRKWLPDIICISDDDMDPKNVMWENGQPLVIDLECLGYGNPASDALQLSLVWAGTASCRFEPTHIKAFFEGYLAEYDNGFRKYADLYGLAYSWIEWLSFNLRRATDSHADETDKERGTAEVRQTLRIIRYLYESEPEIKKILSQL